MYWVKSFDDTSSMAIFFLSMYRSQRVLVMEAIHLICYSILLWTIIGHTNGHQDGASVTSCYTHVIIHEAFTVYTAIPCIQSDRCTDLTLTALCPEQNDKYCCRNFSSNIIYTHCKYTCKFRIQFCLFYFLLLFSTINRKMK